MKEIRLTFREYVQRTPSVASFLFVPEGSIDFTPGQFLQLLFFMSDSQMRDRNISQSDFELHAMLFYAEPQGRIIG